MGRVQNSSVRIPQSHEIWFDFENLSVYWVFPCRKVTHQPATTKKRPCGTGPNIIFGFAQRHLKLDVKSRGCLIICLACGHIQSHFE